MEGRNLAAVGLRRVVPRPHLLFGEDADELGRGVLRGGFGTVVDPVAVEVLKAAVNEHAGDLAIDGGTALASVYTCIAEKYNQSARTLVA